MISSVQMIIKSLTFQSTKYKQKRSYAGNLSSKENYVNITDLVKTQKDFSRITPPNE